MKLNIIHLPKRKDRYDLLVKELSEQDISDYEIWHGEIVPRSRRTGICRSHKKIVQYAKDNNIPKVVIAEDDIKFFAKGAWEYYLQQMPDDFDLYFGMVFKGQIDSNNRLVEVAHGMTLYTVHERFYDYFLSIDDNNHIDLASTKEYKKYKFIVCNPFVCTQNGTYSDNSFGCRNYEPLLVGRKIFGRD